MSQTPEDGITVYSADETQGPACAITCAAGTVVRNYFGLTGCGQTCDAQINNLSDIEELIDNANEEYFSVVGGYTLACHDGLARLTARLSGSKGHELREVAIASLRIGLQSETEVTGCHYGNTLHTGPQQLVSQAYCSACSPRYSRDHFGETSNEEWSAFASLVLEAAYEATMLAAVLNALKHVGEPGCKRVFLTALGGGAFGNDVQWIVNAMRRAFELFRGVGLQVIVVSRGGPWQAVQPLLGDWSKGRRSAKLRTPAKSNARTSKARNAEEQEAKTSANNKFHKKDDLA